jgi:hypothetical protein
MSYLVAIALSLVVSMFSFTLEIVSGNIRHVKNGRKPDAGAALFPNIPFIQVLAVGITWLVEKTVPDYTMTVVLGGFAVITVAWLVAFLKLRAEFAKACEKARR